MKHRHSCRTEQDRAAMARGRAQYTHTHTHTQRAHTCSTTGRQVPAPTWGGQQVQESVIAAHTHGTNGRTLQRHWPPNNFCCCAACEVPKAVKLMFWLELVASPLPTLVVDDASRSCTGRPQVGHTKMCIRYMCVWGGRNGQCARADVGWWWRC
jgi:hypothetical protein